MPPPVSATEIATPDGRAAAATVIEPPAAVARAALLTRLVMTRSICARSTKTGRRSGAASVRRRQALALDLQPQRLDRIAHQRRGAHRRPHRRDFARFDLREIEQLPHQAIEPGGVVAHHLQDVLLPFAERAGGVLEQQVDAHLDAG